MNKEENKKEQGTVNKDHEEGASNLDAKDMAAHENEKSKKKNKKSAHDAECSKLQHQVNELNDKYLRLYSEFDNYRRRTLREKAELSKTASEETILSLLPVIDDLERAMKSTLKQENGLEVIPREGIELIYQKFKNLLFQKGLEAIPAVGEVFNVDFHDALTNIPVEQEEMKGKVVDEVERGYKLGGKVIRFAKVVVGS